MAEIYQFGPFRYDPAQRQLFRDGVPVALVPKAADTLHALLERRGEIVPKQELMKLVWPDTVVEEIGLARNISILRKALGEDSAEGGYIETVPKRGYRFAAAEPVPVTEKRRWWIPAAAGAAVLVLLIYWQFYRPSRFLPAGGGRASVGVMPFEALSPAPGAEFVLGFHEVLAAAVSKTPDVTVVSPATVRRYRDQKVPANIMARVLGLEVILEGTVQLAGDAVRVTARLADVPTGKLIWSEVYDFPAGDPAAAQRAAAERIAAQAGAHLAIRRGR